MEEKIFIAGFGGQGVVLAGKVLSQAALYEGKHILGMVSYGAEMRGGASMSSVIISDEEIDCPIVEEASIVIALSQEAYDKYKLKVKKGGLLLVDSSRVKIDQEREGITIIRIPTTEIAEELGNVKVSNMLWVGVVLEKTKIVKTESALESLSSIFSGHRKNLLYINELALKKGIELARG